MIDRLIQYNRRPALDAPGSARFWDDPHISKHMMEAHLNPDIDSATRTHAFVRKSADWIASLLPPREYPDLLDLGCGPGVYAELFCEQGYRVTGIDLSQRAIDYARRSAERKGLDIAYTAGSYLEMDDRSQFDLATLIYCDYGALDRAARLTLLGRVFAALKPGGRLLLDVFTRDRYAGKPEEKSWHTAQNGFWSKDPYLCLQAFYRYDAEAAFLDQYLVVTDELDVFCYSVWDHVFDAGSLADELGLGGFSDFQFYADVAGAPLEDGSPTLCAVCRKVR